MKLKKKWLSFILFSNVFFGQSVTEIERDILQNLNKIEQFDSEQNQDSLSFYNQNLKKKILKYASESLEMLAYSFPNIPKNFWTIATSTDGKFRIYSWNTQIGGSMQFYTNVFQWTDYGLLYAKANELDEGLPGGFYTEIYQLTDELNTFYMATFNAILSGRDSYQAIHCMDFERDKLNNQFKKIKTKSGTTHKLGFAYNFFSVKNPKEIPIKLVHFNKNKNTVSIPVVNTNGIVTPKKITYKYDGDYFVKQSF